MNYKIKSKCYDDFTDEIIITKTNLPVQETESIQCDDYDLYIDIVATHDDVLDLIDGADNIIDKTGEFIVTLL